MMDLLGVPLGALMRLCYQLAQNYGLAIILFTVATKIILFPVSLWVHANGIKMVRIQPAINRLKIQFFGDEDRIADEQAALFKQEKYNPLSSAVPILVQLLLLLGLIQVIYHPLSYILGMNGTLAQSVVALAAELGGLDASSDSAELLALNFIQNASDASAFAALPGMTGEMMSRLQGMAMRFAGFNLAGVPIADGGVLLLIPILAALASVVLSLSQNIINPLQREQGKVGQLSSMAFSVGISLVLGFLVPSGVGFYWICSNLASILQQLILNQVYKPQKHIDYAELEASKKELESYQNVGKQAGKRTHAEIKREKADYRRFFSIVNKHLVFYSEKSGFYKYFQPVIEYLLNSSNLTIHYVTSDPQDQIFQLSQKQPRIRPYYIGEKRLITLLMKMEADMVVMTVPDLEKYHLKRSYIQKDIEYIYMFHYPLSTHLVLQTGALDHYDTIFCVGEFQFDEIRAAERVYGLPPKKLIATGYGQLEMLHEQYQQMEKAPHEKTKILIAPSWQPDNILDSCLDTVLDQLLGRGYEVVVRPHPEYLKRYRSRMDHIVEKYQGREADGLTFELDFTSNVSIYHSDVLITDWSGTAYEFSFVTLKPSVFIDTTPKINNPEYARLGIEPLEFSLRSQVGVQIKPEDLSSLNQSIRELLENGRQYQEKILSLREKYIANFGQSGKIGGQYILSSLVERQKKNRKETA